MKAKNQISERIRRARKVLKNPYAYLNGRGEFDAIFPAAPADVHEARRRLGNQYAYLDGDGGYSEWRADKESGWNRGDAVIDEVILLNGRVKGEKLSRQDIEEIVRRLQNSLWKNRAQLWPGKEVGLLDVLDPFVALQAIGYSATLDESLGRYSDENQAFEVAGLLDNEKREVRISRRFTPVIRNFTAAHELAHAVLHDTNGLHRDRPLNGVSRSIAKDPMEYQADKFAAYFLMPEKIVQQAFEDTFLMQSFVVDTNSVFALGFEGIDSFRESCPTIRDAAKILASTSRFNGEQVVPLAERFGVSVEAMAIRLEELKLVGD